MRVRRFHSRWLAGGAAAGTLLATIAVTIPLASGTSGAVTVGTIAAGLQCGSPLTLAAEPSRVMPLGQNALPGYTRAYCNDFPGRALPPGWDTFAGQPKGDPASMWEPWHVNVRAGVLRLNTYRDPLLKYKWVSGGVCQCGVSRTYGAYFVRTRITGGGASAVALLWPKDNSWPPEVDFLETWELPNNSTSTLHFPIQNNPGDHKIQKHVKMNMLAWHTWGVIWTPTYMKFSVGTYTYWTITDRTEIPKIVMTLDLQQQSWCGIFPGGCPAYATSMLVDWIVEYVPTRVAGTRVTSSRPTIPVVPAPTRP